MMNAKVPEGLDTPSPVFGKGFSPEETPRVQVPDEKLPTENADAENNIPDSKNPTDLNDPKAAILDRIGTETEKSKFSFDNLRTRVFDDLNPLQKLTDALTGGKELDVGDDPMKLMREARASSGMAENFIDHGPRDFETLTPTGTPSLKEILEPFKGDIEGFKAYAIASRAVELDGRGIETGVPIEQAKAFVNENQGKYDKGFRQLVDFQNDTLKYLKDAGVISESAHDQILATNKNYIPFTRVQEDGTKSGSGKSSLNPIKSIYGSDLKLADPFESIIKNTFGYLKIAERNRAIGALVDLAKNTEGSSEFMEKVPTPMKAIEVKASEVAKFMEDNGIQGDPESFDIFRAQSAPLAKDEIAFMNDGKREVYRVGEDVAKALNATDYQPPNVLMKAISIPAKMIRTGAVETVDFLSRHFIRDQVNAFVLSDNGYVPVIDALRGLQSYFKEDSSYQEWLAGGGGMANIVSLDRDYIQSKVFELSKETGLIDKATNVLKNPLQIMQAMAEAITSAPRIGEFIKAREAGKDIKTAAFESRNVTLDNQKMGSDPAVRAASLITAFWNTRIQGVDRLVQSFKDNPARTAVKMSLIVSLPSILLWAQNHDDPRYQEIPRWEKDIFWILMTKDHVFRIPKPFEQGILFGSTIERTLDAFYAHNPTAFKDFAGTLIGGALPSLMPNAFMPMIEQFANKSWMTGGNIVPHSLEKVAPEYQYNNYTTETGKMLGKMIATVPGLRNVGTGNITLASPQVIENYVRAWGGGMGTYALQLADKALTTAGIATPPIKPTSTLADIPVIKAFVVRYPGANAQSIQDFYDNFEKSQTTLATVKHLSQSGDLQAATHFMNTPEAKQSMINLSGIEKSLGTQSKMIQLINANPSITPDEKRQKIDGLYYQMIGAAQLGNKMMRQFEGMQGH